MNTPTRKSPCITLFRITAPALLKHLLLSAGSRVLAAAFIAVFGVATSQVAHAQLCNTVAQNGSTGITAQATVVSSGAQVTNNMVLPASTQLRLDSVATGSGHCDLWYEDWTGGSYHGCTIRHGYERTVNHTNVWADISTATSLNGQYVVGYVFGKNAQGMTADYPVLDTQAANSTGPNYLTLSYPGTYQIHFQAIINTTPCNIAPERTEVITITVYVGEKGDDPNNGSTSCNANVGKPVNVTNGNMYIRQTDYSVPGDGESLLVSRTYNSQGQNKRVGLFGNGWSSELDESVTAYGTTALRWQTPEGRGVIFGRATTSDPYLPRSAPDMRVQIVKNGDGSYTLTYQDGRIHQFNAAGKLLSKTDRNGNQLTLTYDTNGRPVSVTDPFGRTLTLAYGSYNLVSSITDAMGTVATYAYAYGSYGVLRSVTYADGSKYVFAETAIGNAFFLTTVKDALNNVLEAHTYDGQGRALTSERHGGVERYTLSYVNSGETNVTDALGHVTKYFFDKSKGRNVVTRVEGSCSCGGSQVQTWTYDDKLNVTATTNALNQTTTSTYDAQGNRLTKIDALGTTTYTYNQFGEVLTVTDAMGGVTTNTYDAQGNLLSTKDALNNTTSFAYDARGQLTSLTNARNKTTTLTWDTSGRLTQVKDANNNTTSYAYDARAHVTSITNAANQTTGYEYDLAGRLKKVTQPDLSFVTFTYDLAGRRTQFTDARNNSTNYIYDSAYRLTSETSATNQTTSTAYNLMSLPTSRTDASGRTTNFEYDDFNRLVKTIYPPAVTGAARLQETIAYDAAGNVTSRTDTAGRLTAYQYDAANRPTRVTDAANQITQYEYNARSDMTAVVDSLNQRYAFAYDALGRATGITRGGVSMSYAYDAVGNRTARTDYNGAATNYTYDNLNRLTQVAYPDTTSATYAYDALSRLTSATNQNGAVTMSYDNRGRAQTVSDVFGKTITYGYDVNNNRTSMQLGTITGASYTYDALNRLTQLTDSAGAVSYAYDATNKVTSRAVPNGVATSYQYDGLDRLTRLQHVKGATTVADYQYQFNAASQITQIAEPATTRVYAYDQVDRLISMTSPGAPNESYAYDSVGNRTSSHLSASYTHQPFNKLVTGSANTYSYDLNGNLTSKISGAGTWLYTWDYENRLKQVTRPDGMTVTYQYDALGRRVQRTPSSGVATNFSYDGADVVLDVNSDNSTVTYLNGPGMDNKLKQTHSASGTLYFSQDHLGSTTALTDASGTVVAQAGYDAFGNSTSSLPTRYGYAGRELDSDTGLYYYRARWYDSQAGRFLSEDPLGIAGGDVNFYVYVGNSPVNWTDPLGLKVYKCRRPTRFNFWGYEVSIGSHYWLKTDAKEAGLGACGQGVPGQGGSDSPYVTQTCINDHPRESQQPNASCEEVPGVNESLIDRLLDIGKPMGRWTVGNNCVTFVNQTINDASHTRGPVRINWADIPSK